MYYVLCTILGKLAGNGACRGAVIVDMGVESHYSGSIMKATLFSILLALAAVVAVPAAYAEDAAGDSAAVAPEENKVGEALKSIKKYASGKVITEGHGSLVAKWKDHCPL